MHCSEWQTQGLNPSLTPNPVLLTTDFCHLWSLLKMWECKLMAKQHLDSVQSPWGARPFGRANLCSVFVSMKSSQEKPKVTWGDKSSKQAEWEQWDACMWFQFIYSEHRQHWSSRSFKFSGKFLVSSAFKSQTSHVFPAPDFTALSSHLLDSIHSLIRTRRPAEHWKVPGVGRSSCGRPDL